MRFELVVCGVGGQGVLSTAAIVDHAAAEAGLFFKQPEIHGMSQRGGAVSAQIRIADAPIASDLISIGCADAILSVEPMESLRYVNLLSPDGWLVTDVTPLRNITNYPDVAKLYDVLFGLPRVITVDATRLAAKAQAVKAQNMVVLGAAAHLLPFAVEKLEQQLGALFRAKGEHVVASNLRAFRMGLSAGAFSNALRARGLGHRVIAQLLSRLDFDATPTPAAVVDAWANRLARPDATTFGARLVASRDLLPLDPNVPSRLG